VPHVDHEIADEPATVVEVQIVHVAGTAVAGAQPVAEETVRAFRGSHALTLPRWHESGMRGT